MNDRTFAEVYRAFEDKFRGEREMISKRLRVYEPLVNTITRSERKRAIDLGSGRGEWLALTQEWGFAETVGVEPDVTMHEYAAPGVEIVARDALSYLETVPDGSVQLISAFHVIEHVSADYGFRMICEMHRVLAEGGVMIIETPNPENLMVGLWSFHLDRTHQTPLPPLFLDFISEKAGFDDRAIVRLNGSEAAKEGTLIGRLAMSAPDFAIVAVKSSSQSKKAVDFSARFSEPNPADYAEILGLEKETLSQLQTLESNFAIMQRSLETIQLSLHESTSRLSALEDSADRQEKHHSALQKNLTTALYENNIIINSRSWRITQPLRRLSELYRDITSIRLSRLHRIFARASDGRMNVRSKTIIIHAASRLAWIAASSPHLVRAVRYAVKDHPALKRRLLKLLTFGQHIDLLTGPRGWNLDPNPRSVASWRDRLSDTTGDNK